MRVMFIVTTVVLHSTAMWSQKLLINTEGNSRNNIYLLDLKNCQTNLWCKNSTYFNNSDLAIVPGTNEAFDVNTAFDLFFRKKQDSCSEAGIGPIIKSPQNLFINNGKESDINGFIWLLGESGAVKVKPKSLYYEFKPSSIPGMMQGGGYTLLGSKIYALTVRNVPEVPFKHYIIEYDTSDLTMFRIVGSYLNVDFPKLSALLPVNLSCGEYKLLVTSFNKVYEVNRSTGSLTLLCTLPVVDTSLGNGINGGASFWPYDPKDCDVFIDLDVDNSSGEQKNGFHSEVRCNYQKIPITDSDINIYSDYGIMDSIEIRILNGLGKTEEELKVIDHYSTIHNERNGAYTLYPVSNANNDSLELMIQSIYYLNYTCPFNSTDRVIQFITYKNDIRDTAYCTIKFSPPLYTAGRDKVYEFCQNDGDMQLNSLLDTCASKQGTWVGHLFQTNIFSPSLDSSQEILYIVGDSICGFDTALYSVQVIQLRNSLLPNDTAICREDSLKINLGPGKYVWNDGDTTAVKTLRNQGRYWVQEDKMGCLINDSILLNINNEISDFETIYICPEDSLLMENKFFYPGDTYKRLIPSNVTCDTIKTITLLGYAVSPILVDGNTIICSKKDSKINVQKFKDYRWSTGDTTSEVILKAGIYQLTVTDDHGCTSDTTINIRESPPIGYKISVVDPLCDEQFGKISLQNISGGTGRLRYYANGIEWNSTTTYKLQPGKYIIQVFDSLGCLTIDSAEIKNAIPFDISLEKDSIEVQMFVSEKIRYLVKSGNLKLISFHPDENIRQEGEFIIVTASKNIDYELVFEDENGCIINKVLKIRIVKEDDVYIPNIFSPNGDGVNDSWSPKLGSSVRLASLSMYDRWGNQLYYSTNQQATWDGTSDGKIVLSGVYVYHLMVVTGTGEQKNYYGDVMVVR